MRVRGLVFHTGVELTLGAILIPSHGCLGAAIAQVVAQGADLAFAFVVLVRIERMTMLRHALLPAIACLPMAGAVILAREYGLAAGIAAGVASYGVGYAIVLLLGRRRADMAATSDHENAHEHEDGARRS
jgi:O-antigen/teichoic acid export membrane protein